MLLNDYLKDYFDAELPLRSRYGDLAYFSKPVIYKRDDQPVAVAPWGNYVGEPLILPDAEHVDYIAITRVTPDSEMETSVFYLSHVISLLAHNFKVDHVERPIKHTVIYIPHDPDQSEAIHQLVEQLPQLSG